MPFTNWKSWASADTLTAADMNAYTRDNGRWLSHNATGGAPMCKVFNSASQQIANATGSTPGFDSEDFDVGTMHSTSSNTGRITIPSGGDGKYLVGAWSSWAAHATGRRTTNLRLNGGGTSLASTEVPAVTTAGVFTQYTTIGFYDLNAGDYVDLQVTQDSGGGLDFHAGSRFWALWQAE